MALIVNRSHLKFLARTNTPLNPKMDASRYFVILSPLEPHLVPIPSGMGFRRPLHIPSLKSVIGGSQICLKKRVNTV